MIGITGATGKLGRLVIDTLLQTIPASDIAALARSPDKAAELAAKGVAVRQADYDRPETLDSALAGIERLLLISSNEMGRRVPQHRAVIAAAQRAKVKLLAYTSLLHADRSPLAVREEHVATEAALAEAAIPHVLLRNGWYIENYTGSVGMAIDNGSIIGAAGDGRISAAARADYAAGAAAVLTATADQSGQVYELAGDTAFTLAELAAQITRLSGKTVTYRDLPADECRAALVVRGLPEPIAARMVASDIGIAKGGLFDDSRQLSRLIGRPTTPLSEALATALKDRPINAH
ncbi:nmrA-like family protein [Sphingomonas sp. S17]|jgi:NAD(P)H dehydrogenase (quinone)|uniref:DNA, contig: SP643 n=1 Tax=Sphingomonas paucimobilis NBRC 13935 TaxID=1219050 RepID=A0A0C9NEJ5_SPHPI|nr:MULTISPECIES: SDR family oxidoreductase [Sphingomonas]EGI53707.1 nmrA-like family protein [Sphingomonas sp. S17]QPS14887.1 SDR family oxidoreductase [Sphingomonas paucimobilis]GAN14682.1 putative NAD(P)H--quinone oxidoreductase [Sphingomonas paucimobilis NBRC 13935]SUK03624.1 Quinone oxidoreductase 2 [Sphingomonas paucimobilis]